jgi:hypothetical protein
MPKVQIKDLHPLDGEYDFNVGEFTHGDWHTIKKVSGVRAGEFMEALTAADTDVVVALAVIALEKAGKQTTVEYLWSAKGGQIRVDFSDEKPAEDDALPPVSSSADETKQSASIERSSLVSNGAGADLLETNHEPTGIPV